MCANPHVKNGYQLRGHYPTGLRPRKGAPTGPLVRTPPEPKIRATQTDLSFPSGFGIVISRDAMSPPLWERPFSKNLRVTFRDQTFYFIISFKLFFLYKKRTLFKQILLLITFKHYKRILNLNYHIKMLEPSRVSRPPRRVPPPGKPRLLPLNKKKYFTLISGYMYKIIKALVRYKILPLFMHLWPYLIFWLGEGLITSTCSGPVGLSKQTGTDRFTCTWPFSSHNVLCKCWNWCSQAEIQKPSSFTYAFRILNAI